jgi:hypothetical protein
LTLVYGFRQQARFSSAMDYMNEFSTPVDDSKQETVSLLNIAPAVI